jgi:hypothetical protein
MEMARARRLGLQRAVRFGAAEPFEVAGRNASAIATIDWREQKITFADQSCAGLVLRNLHQLIKYDPSEPRDEQGRWTDAGGAAGGEPPSSSLESGKVNPEWVSGLAHEVFDKMDHQGGLLINNNDPPEFSAGDNRYRTAGTASVKGLVTLYPKGMQWMTRDQIAGLISHEVEHVKFFRAKEAHDREQEAIARIPVDPDPKKEVMRADGLLNSPYDKQFPNYQEFEKAYFIPDTAGWRQGDGVSNYSIDWWKEQQANRANNEQAINETLAEMAKAKYLTGKLPEHAGPRLLRFRPTDPATGEPKSPPSKEEVTKLTKQWRDLYDAVEHINARLKK